MMQTTRRTVLVALAGAALAAGLDSPLHAQSADTATSTVRSFGDRLVAVINGQGSLASKHAQLQAIIDGAVDVAGVARFCLGRFWAHATPAQQQRYVTLFHKVIVTAITSHLGDFAGVGFSMTSTQQRGDNAYVGTNVRRPQAPAADVQWVVSEAGGSPKIIDVVAEGTHLTLTQRSDYESFLNQHGDSIDALLDAIQRQVSAQ